MSRKLYKSNSDKKIAGVCGGIAEYFHIDSTIIRLIWCFFALYGIGFVFYLICTLAISEKNK